jgi:PAS domain S-box-containing protein
MPIDELTRSLALQQCLFDHVPQLIWLADQDGRFTFVNRMWPENIGLVADDWMGDGWSNFLHPDDLDRVMQSWREAVRAKGSLQTECRFLHRKHGYHDYQVGAHKVIARTGEPTGWMAICSDVTDSRRREDAMRVAHQELEAFSASVSHDLRAPLRTISGFSERLQLESGDHLDEQGRHYLERIRAGAANLNDLIDDLLTLFRVTRNGIAEEKVDLGILAHQVFEEMRRHQADRVMEIVVQEGMTAIGDPRLLRVVLVNLIGNALKFSGKREVSRVEVGEDALPGGTSLFFVRDNGAGFDPAYAAKLFGIFQRLHSVKEFPGRGIGLATVQRIIHRHGGRVSAEGAVDQGAKICFSLRRE